MQRRYAVHFDITPPSRRVIDQVEKFREHETVYHLNTTSLGKNRNGRRCSQINAEVKK